MKPGDGYSVRFAVASLLGLTLAVAAPVAAWATPTTPSKASPTTTTTTRPGKNAQAIAKLVIKPASVGHVSVETAGKTTFTPGKDGQSLHVGDTIQTDATGQAEIDYADTAWTRLDVNTTFTIKKLTDDQGNRQVEGSLDIGRTYNRTAALTQSQTFQQDGGGATAAVAGTAFVVTCTSATTCTFTAVIDNINLTGGGGATKTLNPLDECVDDNGALCGTTTRLTPDELSLIQWIQTNVYLDLVEHGVGDGVFQPFAATVTVTNAVVESVTPSPVTPSPAPTPSSTASDADLAIGTAPNQSATATSAAGAPVTYTPPTATDEGGEHPAVTCNPPSGSTFPVGTTTVTCTATDSDDANSPQQSSFLVTVSPDPEVNTTPTNLSTGGDDVTNTLNFQLTGGTDSGQPFSYQYTQLNLVGGTLVDSTSTNVNTTTLYAPSTTFTYTPPNTDPENGPTAVLNYQTVDNATQAASPSTGTVNINVPNPPGEG